MRVATVFVASLWALWAQARVVNYGRYPPGWIDRLQGGGGVPEEPTGLTAAGAFPIQTKSKTTSETTSKTKKYYQTLTFGAALPGGVTPSRPYTRFLTTIAVRQASSDSSEHEQEQSSSSSPSSDSSSEPSSSSSPNSRSSSADEADQTEQPQEELPPPIANPEIITHSTPSPSAPETGRGILTTATYSLGPRPTEDPGTTTREWDGHIPVHTEGDTDGSGANIDGWPTDGFAGLGPVVTPISNITASLEASDAATTAATMVTTIPAHPSFGHHPNCLTRRQMLSNPSFEDANDHSWTFRTKPPERRQVLRNPSFEEFDDDSWTFRAKPRHDHSASSLAQGRATDAYEAFDGSHVVGVSVAREAGPGTYSPAMWQVVPICPGASYIFSVQLRSIPSVGGVGSSYPVVVQASVTGKAVWRSRILNPDEGWVGFQGTWTAASDTEAVDVRLEFENAYVAPDGVDQEPRKALQPGYLWVDQVTFTQSGWGDDNATAPTTTDWPLRISPWDDDELPFSVHNFDYDGHHQVTTTTPDPFVWLSPLLTASTETDAATASSNDATATTTSAQEEEEEEEDSTGTVKTKTKTETNSRTKWETTTEPVKVVTVWETEIAPATITIVKSTQTVWSITTVGYY